MQCGEIIFLKQEAHTVMQCTESCVISHWHMVNVFLSRFYTSSLFFPRFLTFLVFKKIFLQGSVCCQIATIINAVVWWRNEWCWLGLRVALCCSDVTTVYNSVDSEAETVPHRCAGSSSQVVSVMDSGAEGPGFKSQPRRCRVTVLGKLFTPIVPLFTKHRNW